MQSTENVEPKNNRYKYQSLTETLLSGTFAKQDNPWTLFIPAWAKIVRSRKQEEGLTHCFSCIAGSQKPFVPGNKS
jgi:hypothetical protein